MSRDSNYNYCYHCNDIVAIDDLTEVQGYYYCESCLESRFYLCDDCGEYTDETWTAHDSRDNEIEICECCRDNGDYRMCDRCDGLHHEDNVHTDNYHTYCDDCMREYYVRCEDCEEIIREDNAYNEDDGYYCNNCWQERADDDGVHEYDYMPDLDFFGDENKLFMGLEVEMDEGGESHTKAQQITSTGDGHVYCKHDGSLSDGIEMVTHPATVQYHLSKFPWKQLCQEAKSLGYRSHDTSTCGLHVHMSRKGFGENWDEIDLNIAKLLLFFENNWADLVRFSRRTMGQLNRWAGRYGMNHGDDHWALLNRAKNAGKYYSVNLNHSETVEIRIFRGTIKYETIYATIQLLDTIVELCKETSVNDMQNITFVEVFKRANKKGYKELVEEIVKRKIKIEHKPRQIKLIDTKEEFKIGDYVRIIDASVNGIYRNYNDQCGRIVELGIHPRDYRVELDCGESWWLREGTIVLEDECD